MSKVICNCCFCGKQILKSNSDYNKVKNTFCDHSCAAKYNNCNRNSGVTNCCLNCNSSFSCWPSLKTIKKFCSSKCRTEFRQKNKVSTNCLCCGVKIISSKVKIKKFCSGTCRNKINNKNICGQRSKIEHEFEKEIKRVIPNLSFIKNDRQVLNGLELDFYFPELNAAIEFNGIWHTKPIHGYEKLIKVKYNDECKKHKCNGMNMNLLIVEDNKSSSRSIKENINKSIDFLKSCILEKRA